MRLWMLLALVCGVPRIAGALLLPNAFGDAYVYIRDAGAMSAKLSAGTFTLTDLYGFWLPLYQFICAVVSAVVGHPFYVTKLVSALCGVGVCLLVYDVSLRLTGRRAAALLAFLLIALSPLHIFNSASAMTDVPHAFFVMAAVACALRRRWIASSIFVALAGLTRMDSWLLIPLLPLLQFLAARRVSLLACAITLLPPLFWFYLSWLATADWLDSFVARRDYLEWLLKANPSLASFSLSNIARDGGSLLLGTDLAVLIACCGAALWASKRLASSADERERERAREVLTVSAFFFLFLAFFALAYVTHRQPIIFPRYGLILFALGLPLLPWAVLKLKERNPQLARKFLTAVIVVCLLNVGVQLTYSVGYINRENTHAKVAGYLRAHFPHETGARIFSDDGTVVLLSGLPNESFHTSADAPRSREEFINYLSEQKVMYLVFAERDDSTPVRLFPELRGGAGNELFQLVLHAESKFLPRSIWLYKVQHAQP